MARLRPGSLGTVVLALACAFCVWGANKAEAQGPVDISPIYDRPVLILDPGMHTDKINAIAADQQGHLLVTASTDKTVRIWDAASGALEQTVHAPNGPNLVGAMYAVAIEPNGGLVAAGGWTDDRGGSSIYLIDPSRGKIVQRIPGMPNATTRLAFSADGRYLAAGTVGLRVFDRNKHWAEVAKDDDYGAEIYGLSFASDGRLATASADGLVRLYSAQFRVMRRYLRQQGVYPQSVAFSPTGSVLAVGYTSLLSLALLDGHTLAKLPDPNLSGLYGYLNEVAWSRDGRTLFSNLEQRVSLVPGEVIACDQAGRGACQKLLHGVGSSISSIASLPAGGLVIAGGGPPYLAALNADGSAHWQHRSRTANFQSMHPLGEVAADGTTVDFRFQPGNQTFRFSVTALNIVESAAGSTAEVAQTRDPMPIRIDSDGHATIAGRPIAIDRSEVVESRAVHPAGDQFVLGTNAGLYLFKSNGELVWRRYVPSDVRAIQLAGIGRLLIAALSDGTIRWFKSDTGTELLALMPLAKSESGPVGASVSANTLDWVAWTPDGFYTSTPGASRALQWLANHGVDAEAIVVAALDIPSLRRPKVLALMLRHGDAARALGEADLAAVREEIKIATNAERPPGARLHILAIGISDYGPRAKSLSLRFAEKDAYDIANKLVETQGGQAKVGGGFYADVLPIFLPSANASRTQIFQSLDDVKRNMSKGDGRDVAVVMFSGHGAKINDDFYLLPYGVDAATTASIEASAIPAEQLRGKLDKFAAHGFVLVLLDACRSGAVTGGGVQLAPGADGLRSGIFRNGVVVLASSSGAEDSVEDPKWEHGAFTKVLLDALAGAAASGGAGQISVGELTAYLQKTLPELTGGAQHLGVSMDFQRVTTNIFVVGK